MLRGMNRFDLLYGLLLELRNNTREKDLDIVVNDSNSPKKQTLQAGHQCFKIYMM